MARYIKDFPAPYFPETLFTAISQYLYNEGYSYTTYNNNEEVFQKGKGFMSIPPSFIKLSYVDNAIRLEAWLKRVVVAGVFLSEMHINDALGLNGPIKKRVAQIEAMIMQFINTGSVGDPAYQQSVQPQQYPYYEQQYQPQQYPYYEQQPQQYPYYDTPYQVPQQPQGQPQPAEQHPAYTHSEFSQPGDLNSSNPDCGDSTL